MTDWTERLEGELVLARVRRIFEEVHSSSANSPTRRRCAAGASRWAFPPMFGLHYFPKLIMAFRTRRRSIRPTALADLPMVVLSKGFLQRELLDKYCEAHKVSYRKVMESNFVHMTILAAKEGHGAATLLRSLIDNEPGLAAVSFEPRMWFQFDLCWRRDRYFSKASQALVDFASGMLARSKSAL